MLDISKQVGGKLGQRLSLGLGIVKHLDGPESGDFDFLFLHHHFSIGIQYRGFGIRVQLLLLDFLLVGGWGDDGDTTLTPLHMAFKLLPFVVTGYSGGTWALQADEHLIVDGVGGKAGHDFQIFGILIAGKHFPDACLNLFIEFFQSFLVGGLISHEGSAPFLKKIAPAGEEKIIPCGGGV